MSSNNPCARLRAFVRKLASFTATGLAVVSAGYASAATDYPPPLPDMPLMRIVHRVDFTSLKDFRQTLPPGSKETLRLPAELPFGNFDNSALYRPIDQGEPLNVTVITPPNATGTAESAPNIGSMTALALASQGAPGLTAHFKVRNLVPGQTYRAVAFTSARAEIPVPGARMTVTGAGIAPPPHEIPTSIPTAPRVRNLAVVFSAPEDGTIDIAITNPRQDAPLYLRSVQVNTHPAEKPVPDLADVPPPGNAFDFSKVNWTDLHVASENPAASDRNPATADQPLKTLGAAIALASPLLRDGTPVRILVAAGFYREGSAFDPAASNAVPPRPEINPLTINGALIGGLASQTPLAIIGEAPGKVIVTGADRYDDWQLADPAKNLWRHPWPHNWGPTDKGFYPISDPIKQRSEVLTLDGRLLDQVLIENVKYHPGKFVDFGPGMSRNLRGSWTFEGYLGPDALAPGQFGVAEFGPGETIAGMTVAQHPAPNTLWVRLPAGAEGPQPAVEVSVRSRGLNVQNKSQVWLKNLTFTQFIGSGTAINLAPYKRNQNIRLEHCTFTRNLDNGLYMGWTQNITAIHCRFEESGRNEGAYIAQVKNGLFTHCSFDRNGWRATRADGLWLSAENVRFEDTTFNDNQRCGIWQDIIGHHLAFVRCQFNRNANGGAEFEIPLGPILLQDSEFIDNAGPGIRLEGANHVLIDRCKILNNLARAASKVGDHRGQIDLSCHPRNSAAGQRMSHAEVTIPYPYVNDVTLRDSLIVGRGTDIALIAHRAHEEKTGNVPAYADWYRTQFKASGNTYRQPDNPAPFHLNAEYDPAKVERTDLSGWQKATGQDRDSRWQAPPPEAVPAAPSKAPAPAKNSSDDTNRA
jgi:hypothetical protein